MIEKEMSRRSLFKSSLVGATAVGAAGFGLASTAEAPPRRPRRKRLTPSCSVPVPPAHHGHHRS